MLDGAFQAMQGVYNKQAYYTTLLATNVKFFIRLACKLK
jgi:hypothetical protein